AGRRSQPVRSATDRSRKESERMVRGSGPERQNGSPSALNYEGRAAASFRRARDRFLAPNASRPDHGFASARVARLKGILVDAHDGAANRGALARVSIVVFLTACVGCAIVPRSRMDECQRLTQTLRAENARLKDRVMALLSQNRDYSERAVDD